MNPVIRKLHEAQLRNDLPDFRAGDTVRAEVGMTQTQSLSRWVVAGTAVTGREVGTSEQRGPGQRAGLSPGGSDWRHGRGAGVTCCWGEE